MKNRKGKRGKLTRETIVGAGYSEISPGVWGKGGSDLSSHHSGTQSSGMERDPQKNTSGKARSKRKGEAVNPSGIRYQLLIVSYRSRPVDPSNLCGKFIEDALVNEKLFPDDNVFVCPRPPIIHQIIGLPPSEHRTEIFLFKLK